MKVGVGRVHQSMDDGGEFDSLSNTADGPADRRASYGGPALRAGREGGSEVRVGGSQSRRLQQLMKRHVKLMFQGTELGLRVIGLRRRADAPATSASCRRIEAGPLPLLEKRPKALLVVFVAADGARLRPTTRYFLASATWPRPSRTSFPLKCALSTRFDGSAFSPRFGTGPV